MWFGIDKDTTMSTTILNIDAKYAQNLIKQDFDLSKMCLGIGNEPIYEPYVGGQPSPSPDYPQEIESVGDSGSVAVKVMGKNILDMRKSRESITNSGVTYARNADYSFTRIGTATDSIGKGYVVASLGTDSGYVPYTAFSAKKSYLDQNPEVIQGFVNALQKGMDYVQAHSPEEIAKVIAPQFDETDLETITKIVTRYYEQDTWKADLVFEEDSFDLLQDILEDAGELTERAPYKDLVTTEFAEKAIQ